MSAAVITKPKLYALLVGIIDYQQEITFGEKKVYFPKLSGCLDDTQKINNYLLSETYFEPHIKALKDHEATKTSIVESIKNYLGQATESDVVFFYFSGHGTQEYTDKSIFPTETDERLESIVCYYDEQTKSDFLLADKELRWLIHELSKGKPHIVTIFDCCHSGDNTRNAVLLNNSFTRVVEKRLSYIFPQRNWDKFIFSNSFSKEQFLKDGINKLIPEGSHFQFSACESDESAVEIGGEGIFTKVLLSVLNEAGGEITYHSLFSRIKQYMRNVYEQKPKVYVSSDNTTGLFKAFLNKPYSETKNAFGEVTFNSNNAWQLNLGAINGISKSTSTLYIFDPSNPDKLIKAKIGSIEIDYSDIIPEEELNKEIVYKTNLEGLITKKIRIHFATDGAELADQKKIFEVLFNETKQYIVTEEVEEKAQYCLRYLNGQYYFTYPNDSYRPLLMPIKISDKMVAIKTASNLKHISNWEFIKKLNNLDEGQISEDDLKVEIAIGLTPVDFKIVTNNETININYFKKNDKWQNAIRIRLTNTTDKNLYCCALYLMSNYASYLKYLNPPVILLSPGNSVELTHKDNSIIEFGFNLEMKWYNWKEFNDYFKFIISYENFDSTILNLEPLQGPKSPRSQEHDFHVPRSAQNEYSGEIIDFDDTPRWYSKQFELCIHNPEYNMISETDLCLMLNDPDTADFALGLYFDSEMDFLSTSLKLKSEIQINEQLKKGWATDRVLNIANWWARGKRNHFFDEAVKRFPNRIKIVSEGDSWFQHPLVLDVIDHLQRIYNIYCVASAGDSLRNYFSNQKENGEFFMDAIDKYEPIFFLISGGGNDILGSQFRNYLTDKPDNNELEGRYPERFLRKELLNEMDALMEIYKTEFKHLETHKPNLHILVHGYDYPVKLNDAKKGWLGKYMIEKGIYRQGDRQAIIRYIMDLFNEKLSSVCMEFKNTVTYIDVRNIVRYDEVEKVDQWYDEIHPTNDGFQQIAMKFIQTIDKIVKDKGLISPLSVPTPK